MLALLQAEAGAQRVEAAVHDGGAVISWINLGEVWYITARRRSSTVASAAVEAVAARITAQLPDAELVLAAGALKADHRLSYADAFAVATATRHRAPLLTGDPEVLALPRLCEMVDLRGT